MVVGSCALRVGGDEFIAPDMADFVISVLLHYHFLPAEDELYQFSILLHLMTQVLRVIAVYLHMAVEGPHLLRPVEQVVGVAGPVIRCEVPRIVVGKCGFHSPFRVFGQVVRRVVLIALLHSCRYPAAAVPGSVVVELLGTAGVFHSCQLVQAVVGVAGVSA